MRLTDQKVVRVKELENGYALYRVTNARGWSFSTIDDEVRGIELLSSDQGEEGLIDLFRKRWCAGELPHYDA